MSRRRLLLVAVLLQVLWLGLQWRRCARQWEADRILKAVETSTAETLASRRAAPAVLLRNAEELTRAEHLAPASASIRLAKGSQYLLLGRNELAIQAYEAALRLEPRPEIYLNLGRAQWRAGREESALGNFRLAVRLDPNLVRELPPAAVATLRGRSADGSTLDGGEPDASELTSREQDPHD